MNSVRKKATRFWNNIAVPVPWVVLRIVAKKMKGYKDFHVFIIPLQVQNTRVKTYHLYSFPLRCIRVTTNSTANAMSVQESSQNRGSDVVSTTHQIARREWPVNSNRANTDFTISETDSVIAKTETVLLNQFF